MSYVFHPGAEAEHLEAIAFYESQQRGLGSEYLAEFEQVLTVACKVPTRYRIERKPDIRCIYLKRFPYKIIFRDVNASIQILAIAHKRRRPDYWLDRIRP